MKISKILIATKKIYNSADLIQLLTVILKS